MNALVNRLDFSDIPGICSLVALGGLSVAAAIGIIAEPHPPTYTSRAATATSTAFPVVSTFKWFACPVSAIATAWAIGHSPSVFTAVVPALFTQYATAALNKVLPVHPKNLDEAFQLGVLHERMEAVISSGVSVTSSAVSELLAKAAQVAGRAVSLADLRAVPAELRRMAEQRSLTERILSVFSLINIAWGISILGITATLAPFLHFVAEPFARLLVTFFEEVILPFLRALQPAYEPLAYLVALFFLVESARYPLDDFYQMGGTFTSLTGIAAFFMSWLYTTHRNATGGGDMNTWRMLTAALVCGVSVPMAILHRSKLLGYLSVTAFLVSVGFSTFATRCCIFIGFDSRDQVVRATVACLLLILGNASARALQFKSPALQPFESAINCVATSVYFLCLDLLSAFGNRRATAFFAGNLVASVAMGTILQMDGLVNSAITWSVVLGMTLYSSNPPKGSVSIVWLFFLFILLYFISLGFSRRPVLITQLFPGF